MSELSDILTVSFGKDNEPELVVLDYAKEMKGVYNAMRTRIGTEYSYTVTAELSVDKASQMAAAMAELDAWAKSGDVDFSIVSGADTLESLVSADCANGVHIELSFDPEWGPTHRQFKIKASGTSQSSTAGVVSETLRYSKAVNLEGLQTRTWSGGVVTSVGTAASTRIVSNRIPATPAGFQQTYKYEVNELDTRGTYEVTQVELVWAYQQPAVGGGTVVDGESVITTAQDEHNREITTYQYNYVGSGALQYIREVRDNLAQQPGLFRCEISHTNHKTDSASGRFEVLESADSSDILEFSEQVTHQQTGPTLQELNWPGAAPVIVAAQGCCWVYEQAGRAVAVDEYYDPPDPLFTADHYLEQPQISYRALNSVELETTWRYRFIFTAQQAPTFPTVITVVPSS